MDLSTSGPSCGTSTSWTDIPDDLEKRLAASQYLVEIGLHGPSEDLAYKLTVALAEARKANKDLYDSMSTEVRRYRERWNRERLISNDLADEVVDLDEQVTLLKGEAKYNLDALITAQERLDNAIHTYDDIAPYVNWEDMINDV